MRVERGARSTCYGLKRCGPCTGYVGSCIASGVEPTAYLTDVLPKIRDATTDDALDALLPDRWRPTSAD